MQVTGSIRIPFVVNGKDGAGIESVAEEYALHTSGTLAPTTGWSDTISNPTKLQPYLWNRETTKYTDGAVRYVPAHVIAMYSADGRGIKSVTNYYLASDQATGVTNETEGFTTSVQEISEKKPYLWNYEEITYDDEEGTTEKTQACIIGVYGLNGIMLVVPAFVNFAPTVTTLNFYVAGWRSGVQLVTSTSQVKAPTSYGDGIIAAGVRGIDASKGVLCEITRTADAVIDWTGDWSVTIEGIAYPFTVTATSVANGEKGDKGDKGDTGETGTPGAPGEDGSDGEDAEVFEIVPSSSNLVYYPGRKAFAPETLTFRLRHTKGSVSEYMTCLWGVSQTVVWIDNESSSGSGTVEPPTEGEPEGGHPVEDTTDTFVFTPSTVGSRLTASVTAIAYDVTGETELARYTVNATSSASLRIRVWDNVSAVLFAQATENTFQDGSVGCTYIDVVRHDYTNTLGVTQELWYMCKKSHIKSTSDPYEPWHDASSTDYNEHPGLEMWTQASKFDMICTQMLLANYAKIDNLYVDDLYMEATDSDGNVESAIWINPLLKGMKINTRERMTATGRENQTEADWNNPTTEFNAKPLSDVEDIYGTGNEVRLNAGGLSDPLSNLTSGDAVSSAVEKIIAQSTTNTGAGMAEGDVLKLTVETNLSERIVEGNLSSASGGVLAFSQVCYELRCAWDSEADLTTSGKYRTVWTWTANGSWEAKEETTTTKGGTLELSFGAEGTTLYFGLYRTSYSLRVGGTASLSGSFTVNGYYVTAKYISQYTAGGMFIGLSSQDYLRVGMNATGEAQHTLLAGGNGVDLRSDAMFQYRNGNRMPFAYTLLAGYFTPDGKRLSAQYWTFDDADCTVEYRGVGYYVITMPKSWVDDYGFDLYSGKSLCITATAHRDNDKEGAYAKVNNIENRTISITTHDADGSMADFPFYMRVDYFPSNKLATATNQSS